MPTSIINTALDRLALNLTSTEDGGNAAYLSALSYDYFEGTTNGAAPPYDVDIFWGRPHVEDWQYPLSKRDGNVSTGHILIYPTFEENRDRTVINPYLYQADLSVVVETVFADQFTGAAFRTAAEVIMESLALDIFADKRLNNTVEVIMIMSRTRYRSEDSALARASIELDIRFERDFTVGG